MNQPIEAPRVLLLLRNQLNTYSQTLQRLGQFVLEQPQRVLYLTITELARERGTSEASVTRLCRGVGCRGYTEFKMALALETQQEQASQPQVSAASAFSTLIEESVVALRDTGALVSQDALLQSAELLEKARHRSMALLRVRLLGITWLIVYCVWGYQPNSSVICIVPR